jgi:hypothetical protein
MIALEILIIALCFMALVPAIGLAILLGCLLIGDNRHA